MVLASRAPCIEKQEREQRRQRMGAYLQPPRADHTCSRANACVSCFVLGYCENPEEEKFVAPNVINKDAGLQA